MSADALSPVMGRRLSAATILFSLAAEKAVAIETAVQALFNLDWDDDLGLAGPIPTVLVPAYLAYARQVAKVKANYSGVTLTQEIAIVASKWIARGLEDTMLTAINGVV
jgi:hypothetical protein